MAAPEATRIAVKLAASMAPPPRASRQSTELAAKARRVIAASTAVRSTAG
jgi:hypothetical protein